MSYFENITEFSVLFSVLFPEIPQIREISRISGAGNSSGGEVPRDLGESPGF